MAVIDELIEANSQYAKKFDKGGLAMPPRRKVAVVTCMDARIVPSRALGLEEGDAHVIRNAGGRAKDALRSLIVSQRLLGTREVAVIHHTDCGMLTFKNEDLRAQVKRELNADAGGIDFLPFSDVERSVRDDVAVRHLNAISSEARSSSISQSITLTGKLPYEINSSWNAPRR